MAKVIYVAQFYDDPYCAPYARYIFKTKEDADKWVIKHNENLEPFQSTDFADIYVYEWNQKEKRYEYKGFEE